MDLVTILPRSSFQPFYCTLTFSGRVVPGRLFPSEKWEDWCRNRPSQEPFTRISQYTMQHQKIGAVTYDPCDT